MDWSTLGLLTAAFLGTAILHSRIIPQRRRIFLILWLLIGLLVVRWANYRSAWTEVGLAAASALMLFLFWWILVGSKLEHPSDENIRVWSEDDPF
ncbi:MAG: hypothetical protein ACLFWD_01595 [Anaerolineales bacterium]